MSKDGIGDISSAKSNNSCLSKSSNVSFSNAHNLYIISVFAYFERTKEIPLSRNNCSNLPQLLKL